MSSDSSFFKLGLFVVAGIALAVAGVVVLGAGALFQEYVTIETATDSSVEGLTVGGAVKHNGVTLGKVSKIEMANWQHSSGDPVKKEQIGRWIVVDMQLRKELLPQVSMEERRRNLEDAVSRGLRARMASSGLTGPAYMQILFLDPAENPAPALPFTPTQLYMPSAPSQMAEIVSDVQNVLDKVKRADVDRIIANFQKLVNDTDKSVNDLRVTELQKTAQDLMDELRKSNRRLQQLLDDPKIDRGIDNLSVTIKDTREITTRVKEIVHDPKLQKTLDDLSTTSSSAAPAAAELRGTLHKLDVLLTSQTQDLEAIVRDLRRMLENGSALMGDLKNNPSRAIFGEPPPHVSPGGQP